MRNQERIRSIGRRASRALRLFVCMTLLLAFAGSAAARKVWDGSADVSWYEAGTYKFTLSTPEQLAGLAKLVNEGNNFQNKIVYLAADILLNDTGGWERWSADDRPANTWKPIGTAPADGAESRPFNGTFDGQGHVVRGVYVNGGYSAGLFGCIGTSGEGRDGSVRGVGVEESYIAGERFAGGIVGYAAGVCYIEKCYNSGLVTGSGAHIGGILGYGLENYIVSSCYNLGRVEAVGESDDARVGGIVGTGIDGSVYDSYNYGAVSASNASARAGAVIGYNSEDSRVENSYFLAGDLPGIGGGATGGERVSVTGKSLEAFRSGEVACSLSRYNHVWGQCLYADPGDAYPVLSGPKVEADEANGGFKNVLRENSGKVIHIFYADELRLFAHLVNAGDRFEDQTVVLMNDIALNDTGDWTSWDGSTRGLNAWTPIGTFDGQDEAAFAGTFDGQGHVVRGIYASGGSHVGLFGALDGATVRDVGVAESFAKGRIAGGIAGRASKSEITGCYFAGRLEGTLVGGIAAEVFSGNISACHNRGTIRGEAAEGAAGGIVGRNDAGEIAGCYNIGTVAGGEMAGGIAGSAGAAGGGTGVARCFYLDTSSAYGIGSASSAEGSMTLAQFRSGEVACRLGEPWGQSLAEGLADPYPVLDGPKVAADDNGGYANVLRTDEEGNLLIYGAADLYMFARMVNAGDDFAGRTVLQMNTVSLNDTESWQGWNESDGPANTWTPIGAYDEGDDIAFSGTFDGQGHYVRGVYVNSGFAAGLFGKLGDGGTVRDVQVIESYITGDRFVGGIVGYNAGGTIEGCIFSGTLKGGSAFAGGVVGLNFIDGVVYRSQNAGSVTGGDAGTPYVGGVAGANEALIDRSQSYGVVRNDGTNGDGEFYVGAVVGDNRSEVYKCWNYGSVEGRGAHTGGIAGANSGTTGVIGCGNEGGTVTGAGEGFATGGIVGYNVGNVEDCYSAGPLVSGRSLVGGIVGYGDSAAAIRRCGNIGPVRGDGSDVGGVAGYLTNCRMESCYNIGTVTAAGGRAGGLLGHNHDDSNVVENGYFQAGDLAGIGGGASGGAYVSIVSKGAEAFKSGEVAYLLGEGWCQPLYVWKSSYPVPSIFFGEEDAPAMVVYRIAFPHRMGYANVDMPVALSVEELLTPEEQGRFERWSVTDSEGRAVEVADNAFVMPPSDVTVVAELPTGIEGLEDVEGLKVYAAGGTLFVQTPGPERVTVISLAGHLVASDTRSGLRRYTGLASGAYLVRIGERTVKIRVR